MKKSNILFLSFSFFVISVLPMYAQAVVVKFEVRTPPDSVVSDKAVFLTGTFNCWNPSDSLYIMKSTGENFYTIDVPLFGNHNYEYKYTRGDWGSVEVSSAGAQVNNRKMLSGNGLTISDTVAQWAVPVLNQPDTTGVDKERMETLVKMKDELSAKVDDLVKPVIEILKKSVKNMLSENPDITLKMEYHTELVSRVDSILGTASDFIWQVTSMLTPEQKKKIASQLNETDDPGAIIDMISKEAVKKEN